MSAAPQKLADVTILFAGDSGDGMQLTGGLFTNTTALFGNDISTFPNFPAEIRAPQGTVAGVSGFKLHFASTEIFTPGDEVDVFVAMNAAAFKANHKQLRRGGTLIANTAGFDKKNLRLAGYADEATPLADFTNLDFKIIEVDVSKLTKEALTNSGLGTKEVERCKNMFVLGLLLWVYNRELETTVQFINDKFQRSPLLKEANLLSLKSGYAFGETGELALGRVQVDMAALPKGTYRSITGNQATAIALVTASQKSGLELFYGSYPITPASDILHELARLKHFGVKTFQAEDEIAAVCAAIGASYGGALGVTASSGPGIALKQEAIGLAVMIELPLLVINVQRGGPSTGLPTKTEQSDLLQALNGRNGESPLVVMAPKSPSDCFNTILESVRIGLRHMVPVMVLSDGYLANGSEPWAFPNADDIEPIEPVFATAGPEEFKPYSRNEFGARPWALPGTAGLMHRVGGLEKQHETGNVSYEPENHEMMVRLRQQKVDAVAALLPPQRIEVGAESGDVLVLGWGSTYGAIRTAVARMAADGHRVSHVHLRHLNPMPSNLGALISKFKHVLVPELNNGQLVHFVNARFGTRAVAFNKIQGLPFTVAEVETEILRLLNDSSKG